jgi:hybrid cluster-associated redox disulfide protein
MDAHPIALDRTIEQVLSDQPALIPAFLTYRLACVGCSMALFCTLEDAVTTYNLPREQFLADLRHAASAPGQDE